jgi:hypothetical protein
MPTRTTSGSTSRSASRTNAHARDEIISMLSEDHKRMKKAFRDFSRMDPHEDPDACQALAEQTCAELEVHAELEEHLFYPAVREVISEHQLIDEAEIEHMTLKGLIGQLREIDSHDEKYAATFKVLGEYAKHHIKEEEGEIFKELSSARLDWPGLLSEMQATREKLLRDRNMLEKETADPADEADDT